MEIDFTNDRFMWYVYSKYTRVYAQKSENSDHLMIPGTFCEYFAINWYRALKDGKEETMDTIDEIIDELAEPYVSYAANPCGPSGCMKIYDKPDGDVIEMFWWNIY